MPTPTAAELRPEPGTPVDEIETPAIVLDLDVFERNVDRYVRIADELDVSLRSHVKTHKVPALAHYQDRASGGGIVCQTISEVEVMAAAGLEDIYLSYQVVGERKLERLVRLAESINQFATTVDAAANADPLGAAAAAYDTTVDVILEVDVGLGRTGVPLGEPAVELARRIADHDHLAFAGVMAYEAHVKGQASTEDEYEQLCYEAIEQAANTVAQIEDVGIPVPELKVGGTATSPYSGRHPRATEINPGQYAFNDCGELAARPWAVSVEDIALTVHSTVISDQVNDQIVADAGSKSVSMDTDRQPLVIDHPDLTYAGYSEEHAHIDTSAAEGPVPSVGDRLAFVPPHICPTINMHDVMVGVRDGVVTDIWAVQARGKVK